jgi:hypothetical protein
LGGMVMGGAYPMAQPGAVGIFGGRLAKTADQAALSRAEDMAAKGASREQIWNDTGWFQGSDGKWRFEIDDYASRMNPNVYGKELPQVGAPVNVAADLWHKELYDAYPELRALKSRVSKSSSPEGYYNSETGNIGARAATPPQAKSVLLHELQHAVQRIEGFPGGTDLSKGMAAYVKDWGEIEARDVQRRMFMNRDERRTSPPWLTEQ